MGGIFRNVLENPVHDEISSELFSVTGLRIYPNRFPPASQVAIVFLK